MWRAGVGISLGGQVWVIGDWCEGWVWGIGMAEV